MTTTSETSRIIPSMGAVLAVLLLVSAGLLYFFWPQANPNDSQAAFGRVVALVQTARSSAASRMSGDQADMQALQSSATTVASQWTALTANAGQRASLGTLAAAGDEIDNATAALNEFLATDAALTRVDQSINRLQRVSPQLLASTRSLFASLDGADAEANQSSLGWLEQAVIGVQSSLAARSAERPAVDLLGRLREDEQTISLVIGGITGTNDALGVTSAGASADPVDVDTTLRLLDEVKLAVTGVLSEQAALEQAEAAYHRLADAAQSLAMRYQNSRSVQPAERTWVRWLLIGITGIALLLSIALVIGFLRARKHSASADVHAEQNERNQHAILRLLDELSNLADGDLTVRATVTEDITGAIADSINYAIEALRDLVITVNESSILVDAAAKQSEATAHHMVRASETQVKQAVAASNSMQQMSASVEEVSGNAERCSDVARHSVEVAHKGGEAVRRTIEGMNTIRETIQDTSKRIKRLGESSQEIGNIVELIEEIADQTNILALNASIEASRAGEASRGFAVVADEVQKLAERSTAATRKIEVLVSTIQSDTNEAVVSMERSTTDVVGGALLAENAGAALEEIEQVSHQIASLVQNISGSAQEQNLAAEAITRNMDVLRDVSARTKQSTTATSSSISKLSELASQLRKTVSGFKLPRSEKKAGGKAQSQLSEQSGGNTTQHNQLVPEVDHELPEDIAIPHEAVGDIR